MCLFLFQPRTCASNRFLVAQVVTSLGMAPVLLGLSKPKLLFWNKSPEMPLCRPVLFCRVPAQLVPFNSLCISFLWGTLKNACITRNAVTGVCLFAETFSVSFQKSKELSLVYYCQCGIFCLKNSEHPLIFFKFEVLLFTVRTNFKIHKSYRSYI